MASRSFPLLIAGYLAAIGLGAYLMQRAPTLATPPAPPAEAAQPLPPLEIPPSAISSLAAFDAIIERPLFSPDRQPEATDEAGDDQTADAEPEDAVTEVDGFRLTAVLRDGESSTVLIEDPTGETRTLHQGERLGSWRLEEIQDDRVMLVGDGRTETLMVYDFSSPISTVPRRAAQRPVVPRPRPAPPVRQPVRPPVTQR